MTNFTIGQANNNLQTCFAQPYTPNTRFVQPEQTKQDSFENKNKSKSFAEKLNVPIGKDSEHSLIAFFLTQMAFAPFYLISKHLLEKTRADSKSNFAEIKELADKMHKSKKLDKNGGHYCFLEKENPGEQTKQALSVIDKKLINPTNYKKFRENVKSGFAVRLNIFNSKPAKLVAAAREEKASVIFHEMGHLVNSLNKYAGKFLLINGGGARFISIGVFIGALTMSLIPKRENKNKQQTSNHKNFLEKHAGLLVSMAYLPCLADEAFASLHALKFVKNNTTNQIFYKALRKNLAFAFSTYLISYLASLISVKVALNIKNHKNPTKKQA